MRQKSNVKCCPPINTGLISELVLPGDGRKTESAKQTMEFYSKTHVPKCKTFDIRDLKAFSNGQRDKRASGALSAAKHFALRWPAVPHRPVSHAAPGHKESVYTGE